MKIRQEEIDRIKKGTQTTIIVEEIRYPNHTNKDKLNLTLEGNNETLKVGIEEVQSKRLEDLTFEDLRKLGYENPNVFIKDREKIDKKKFDGSKVIDFVEFKLID